MTSFHEFIHMGGFAFYVWTSYAIFALVFAWNVFQPLYHQRRVRERLARRSRGMPR